jgi:LacI family transcriptional regulator
MKDVAEHARVSVSTVSYVLNDSGPVAADRRARVPDAIRVLNYTPNESARSLKRRAASTIGLVVPELSNQFFALLAEGVERAASARDVLVVLCAPEATRDAVALNAQLFRGQRLDGVIYLSCAGTSPSALLELTKLGRVVLVDELVPGFDLPAVVSDSRRGGREVARHVLEQGHERITIIGGPSTLWTAEQRLAGYREALAAAGHDTDEVPVLVGDYRQESGFELAAKALGVAPEHRPTVLPCANDLMAIGALEYARSAGINVPADVSIVGFDDIPFARLLTPRLTTVRQPAYNVGHRAATLLLDLLDGKPDTQPTGLFPVTLKVRDSVAPPKAAQR